ncbi:MAG TPA: type II secretion system F family protein [Gemmataceae bacterium]|jgi:tight adherence protein B|nr:type II secretion system F family protein [Gemmataceae bacterium]
MEPIILAGIAFVVVAGAVGLVAFALRGGDSGKTAERLDTLVGKGGRRDGPNESLFRKSAAEDKKTLLDAITPEFFHFTKIFAQSDVAIKPSALFGIALALALAGGLMSSLLVGTLYVAPVGALMFFSIPFLWLLHKRKTRLKKFAAQLPDAMELVARALRAGHSLASGFHVVAEEMPLPIAKEFGRVYEEQNLGISLDDALKNLSDRIPNLDLRFFVTAVNIQRQTGGDLAEILDKIGYVIRERYKILGHVKALTAEGRLSGVVLIAMPFGLFILMLYMKPDYISLLWTDPMGVRMAIFALVLQVLGALCIKKIVDIKV